jgi:hypothetical protein
MPNPPYSGVVIVIRENQDGLSTRAYVWDEKIAATLAAVTGDQVVGGEIPPSPSGFVQTLTGANPSRYFERQFTTRTVAKQQTGLLIDSAFPDTAA